jgi:hypothetical protein
MRVPLLLLGALAMSFPAAGTDFPPPDKLPANPALPDVLTAFDGTKVATTEQWEAKRRPELKALFEHYMYGKRPAAPEKVTGRVLFEDPKALGGKGTLKEVEITFGPPEWPKIYLLMGVPNDRPAPCFVGTNFGGNHLVTADPRVRLPQVWVPDRYPGVVKNQATDAGRGKQPDVWPLEWVVGRGYAVATFYCGDIQPDRPAAREGMRATIPQPEGRGRGDETATIMWWAWGVSRAVDYLATDAAIDANRLAVVGHSRLGKTALLAAAFDDRIKVAFPSQAGCGGTGPSRTAANPKAETVKRITTSFPHWFCGHFTAFGDDPAKLPFDQNALVAACAPRAVLFTNAVEDEWANPGGQFEVLRAAAPAYRLLGVEGVGAESRPEVGTLLDSRLGYWIRPGKHSMTPDDWKTFAAFADKWLR